MKKSALAIVVIFVTSVCALTFQNCAGIGNGFNNGAGLDDSSNGLSFGRLLNENVESGYEEYKKRQTTPDFTDVVAWMNSEFPAGTSVSYHAEARGAAGYDPQALQNPASITASTPWWGVINAAMPESLQVNRMHLDRANAQILWRKDSSKTFNPRTGQVELTNYSGEVFSYDENHVYLRTETMYAFPASIDPDQAAWPKTPFIRSDKFRMFAQSTGGAANANLERLPGGRGRIFGPRRFVQGWQKSQTIDMFACFSNQQYTSGGCTALPGQTNYPDIVSANQLENFSVTFDGEAAGFAPDPEFKSFDRVLVLSVRMRQDPDNKPNDYNAMERYYFGYRENRFYGLVRWDNSVLQGATWVTTMRTVALRLIQDSNFSFDGMFARAQLERVGREPAAQPALATTLGTQTGGTCSVGINDLFLSILQRPASASDLSFYANEVTKGRTTKDIRAMISNSSEFAAVTDNSTFLKRLYVGLLGRTFDALGLAFQLAQLQKGISRAEVIRQFLASAEYQALPDCY